ncbi:TrmH family RNA methyltransferase [Hypnocyclicus thermotrophus]|uniref:TrmH family RNA methyltransferase n=1 Tax=Hypnocyclicus thermotrophus TaxID=1627895 RepID=A0AA46DZS4_9FUSO|nr:RNA methyltransferase [Hypnocyclicus thermotrophus]TDT71972.1 TrmH family RNA methyltransferase [Hypnocyclicus thermotrophus]
MKIISSKENKIYKLIKKIKKKKYREKEKLFIAEGKKFLDFEYKPKYYILNENNIGLYSKLLEKEETYIFSEDLFYDITTQINSQGIILIYEYIPSCIEKIKNNIVILDKIQDPGNLGTIIRLVDAVGLKDIILTKGSVDIYNDKTIRSSMGSIFNLNISYLETDKLIKILKQKEYNIISTALTNETIEYTKMELKEKNAFVFGNEGNGISKEILDISTAKIKIPIYGSAESLNVGVATGIILYKYIEKVNS